jgi:hypothetical protein
MPIAAFIDASQERAAKGEAMGTCALVLPKVAAFNSGARPVIYALSSNAWPTGTTGIRSFDERYLPSQEQYRYIAYDPNKKTLDWTHEREWRWPLDNEPYCENSSGLPPSDSSELPGLELDCSKMDGLGVIVGTQREADMIVHDILTKVDREDISESHYSFIIVRDEIPDWDALRGHAEMEQAISGSLIDLKQFFISKKADAKKQRASLCALAIQIEADAGEPKAEHFNEPGGCWLWLKDNRHTLVRALTWLGIVNVSATGRYLVDLPEIDAMRPLRQREQLFAELCKDLEAKFGIEASYFSVLGSEDYDAVPYYTDDLSNDPFFYNFNWVEVDEDEEQ